MSEHISFAEMRAVLPELPQALQTLADGIKRSSLDARLVHLLEIRASQLNNCAYCLNMHHQSARDHGESQQRLDTLSAWAESALFNERECAALEWCETLTLLPQGHASEALNQKVRQHFSRDEILALTATVVMINSWNRIVSALQFVPRKRAE